MANKLYIDGQEVTNDIEGLDDITIVFQKNETNKVVSRSLSSDLKAKGATFQIFKEVFASCMYDFVQPLRFTTDICGGIIIDTHTTTENLEVDPCNCTATFDLNEQSPELECFRYLDSIAWKQYFLDGYDFPLVWFGLQPNFLMVGALILSFIVKFIAIPLRAILSVIDFLSPGVDLDPLDDLFRLIDTWLTGLGRIAPAPLVRDVLEFHTKNCGLEFKSSIYQDPTSPYYNEAIFTLQGRFLDEDECNDRELIKEVFEANAPIETVFELLEKLAVKYNADFCLKDGCLIFEPKSIIGDISKFPIVADVTELCDNDQELSYSFDVQDACLGHDFEFQRDSVEFEGNEARVVNYLGTQNYTELPTNTLNKRCSTVVQFGATRYMFDETSCRGGFFNSARFIDEFRDGSSGIWSFLGLSNQGVIRNDDLILSTRHPELSKLIILEDNFDIKDAKTVRRTLEGKCNQYNHPNFFDQDSEGNLIDTFHKDRNPTTRKDIIKLNSFTQVCNCEDIQTILDNNTDIAISTHYGIGTPLSIDVEIGNKVIITYKDIRVYCD